LPSYKLALLDLFKFNQSHKQNTISSLREETIQFQEV
jgi:hypothetical protein